MPAAAAITRAPAWYRKKFDAAPDGGKVYLYFEAVMGKCKVWVNGQLMTEHFGGYLPFAIDITKVVNADGHGNVVAVRADNSDDPTYPPGKPQGDLDFTYMGGIYRDTYLIRTGPVHVTLTELSATPAGGGVFVGVKDVNGNDAQLEVRTEVANEGATPKHLTVRSVLVDADGHDLLAQESAVDLAPRRDAGSGAAARAEERPSLDAERSLPAFHPHRGGRQRPGGRLAADALRHPAFSRCAGRPASSSTSNSSGPSSAASTATRTTTSSATRCRTPASGAT
ncbi:MAG: sugar-binding domain-containing protein [Verrucomicrobiota bacterium]